MEEQVGRRLAVLDHRRGEDPLGREEVVQSRHAQRLVHLLRAPLRADARLPAEGAHSLDRLPRAVDRLQLALERRRARRQEALHPAGRQRAPEVRRHARMDVRERHRGTARGPAPIRQHAADVLDRTRQLAHRDALAVDEHAVAVEDDRGRARSPRRAGDQRLLARQRLARRRWRSRPARTRPAAARPVEVDGLVVASSGRAGAIGSVREGPSTSTSSGAPDEPLRALLRARRWTASTSRSMRSACDRVRDELRPGTSAASVSRRGE